MLFIWRNDYFRCGCNKGEKLDFYEFCDFLTAQTEPVPQAGEFVSSSMDSYRASKQTVSDCCDNLEMIDSYLFIL